MYVQVLLIKMHRRVAGVTQPHWLSCQSGINQGAAQRLESRGKRQRLKIQSNLHLWDTVKVVSTEKWQRRGGEVTWFLPITASVTPKKDNIVVQHKYCFFFFAYIQVIVRS